MESTGFIMRTHTIDRNRKTGCDHRAVRHRLGESPELIWEPVWQSAALYDFCSSAWNWKRMPIAANWVWASLRIARLMIWWPLASGRSRQYSRYRSDGHTIDVWESRADCVSSVSHTVWLSRASVRDANSICDANSTRGCQQRPWCEQYLLMQCPWYQPCPWCQRCQ